MTHGIRVKSDDGPITRGPRIERMEVTKSRVARGERIIIIESEGYTFTGYFNDLPSFFSAMAGAMKYFGQAHGLVKVLPDGTVVSRKS